MSSTGTEQVTIDMETFKRNDQLEPVKQMDSLKAGEIATDGRRGHNRHGSNGSHHHSHSGESDVEDRHHSSRRSRRRSRSRSRSPSHRAKRTTDTNVRIFPIVRC